MNKVYERMALSLIEDVKARKPRMQVAKEKPPTTATLHSNYEDLMAYMKVNHPELNHPHTEEGIEKAGSIPHRAFVGFRARHGKNN